MAFGYSKPMHAASFEAWRLGWSQQKWMILHSLRLKRCGILLAALIFKEIKGTALSLINPHGIFPFSSSHFSRTTLSSALRTFLLSLCLRFQFQRQSSGRDGMKSTSDWSPVHSNRCTASSTRTSSNGGLKRSRLQSKCSNFTEKSTRKNSTKLWKLSRFQQISPCEKICTFLDPLTIQPSEIIWACLGKALTAFRALDCWN